MRLQVQGAEMSFLHRADPKGQGEKLGHPGEV